jgi:hypothetical protein
MPPTPKQKIAAIVFRHPQCLLNPPLDAVVTAGQGALINRAMFKPEQLNGSLLDAASAIKNRATDLRQSPYLVLEGVVHPFHLMDMVVPHLKNLGFSQIFLVMLEPTEGLASTAEDTKIQDFFDYVKIREVRGYLRDFQSTRVLRIAETADLSQGKLALEIIQFMGLETVAAPVTALRT